MEIFCHGTIASQVTFWYKYAMKQSFRGCCTHSRSIPKPITITTFNSEDIATIIQNRVLEKARKSSHQECRLLRKNPQNSSDPKYRLFENAEKSSYWKYRILQKNLIGTKRTNNLLVTPLLATWCMSSYNTRNSYVLETHVSSSDPEGKTGMHIIVPR